MLALLFLISPQLPIHQSVQFPTLFHLFGRFEFHIDAASGIQLAQILLFMLTSYNRLPANGNKMVKQIPISVFDQFFFAPEVVYFVRSSVPTQSQNHRKGAGLKT